MKNILLSKTMLGIAITLVSKALGIESGVIQSPVDQIADSWPILVGLTADLGAVVARLKTTRWHKPTGAAWLGIVSGICTILAAFGADADSLKSTIDHGITAWPNIAAICGALIAVYGQITAKKALSVKPVAGQLLLAAMCFFPLAQIRAADPLTAGPIQSCVAVQIKPSLMSGVARLWSRNTKLWPAQATLRIMFLDGSKSQQDKAWREFAEVDGLVGLTFQRVASLPAEIRVKFDRNNGHWSYVGTDCLKVSDKRETMNLALGALEFRSEWRRVAQHEMMHAIGFEHEHQSPTSSIPWNREAVYAYYGQTQGWSKTQINYQVLNRYNGTNWEGTRFDRDSIMQYPVPGALTDGRLNIGWNSRRSPADDAELRRRYPAN